MSLLRTVIAFVIIVFAAFNFPVRAHEAQGPNGGRMVDAGPYHVELVAKGGAIEVFLFDGNDKPVAAAGYKALAILVVGGKSTRIALEAAGARLTGQIEGQLPAAPKGVVQITEPGGKTVQARFN